MRFELEVVVEEITYLYSLALEFPKDFKELRIFEESLVVNGKPIYTRNVERVRLARSGKELEANFLIDWHLVALPVVQAATNKDPIANFRNWLAKMLILRPIPSLITGDAIGETLQPNDDLSDLGGWFTGIMALSPSSYMEVDQYLKQVMPDIQDVQNRPTGGEAKSLLVRFATKQGKTEFPFSALSDGEKCYMICALVLAAHRAYGPFFCFWDEPDNHLALSEVGHFVLTLRKAFKESGQFLATSHNPEAIRRFSDENTILLDRRSHLEPTLVRRLADLDMSGSAVEALLRGELTV